MPYDSKITGSIPYAPVYEEITSCNYSGIDWGADLSRFFVKDGKLDADGLISYLKDISERYVKYTDRTGPGFGRGELHEDMEDRDLANDVIRTLSKYKLNDIDSIAVLKLLLKPELYSSLNVMITVREDERFFSEEGKRPLDAAGSTFDEMQMRISKYGVEPCSNESLAREIGGVYYDRIRTLYAIAAGRGVNENRAETAIRLASKFVTYDNGAALYALSSKFRPYVNNPNHEMECAGANNVQGNNTRPELGYWIFCGLDEFLKGDVVGEHGSADAILHDANVSPIEVNLPEAIEIGEGETIVIKDFLKFNLKDLDYTFEYNTVYDDAGWADAGYHGGYPFDARYNDATNELTLKAKTFKDNHVQPRGKVNFDFRILSPRHTFEGERDVHLEGDIRVVNLDEPPSLVLAGPEYVKEGDLFCINAKAQDPEGDDIKIEWEQKSGAKFTYAYHAADRKLCGQVSPEGKVREPLGFNFVATSVIDNPDIKPASTGRDHLMYVLPRVSIGENVELPIEVVVAMTDPEGDKMLGKTFATEESLYIMMRLPKPLENYTYKNEVDMANEVNAEGCYAKIPKRAWKPFQRVPSEDGIFVYYSRSPLEPYIRPKTYVVRNFIEVENSKRTETTYVRLTGDINVTHSGKAMEFEFGEAQRISDSTVRVIFKMKNGNLRDGYVTLNDGNLAFVNVDVKSVGLSMSNNVELQSVESEGDDDVYAIDIPYPRSYAYSVQELWVEVMLKDKNGKKIELSINDIYRETGFANSIFSGVKLTMPDYPMPYPYMVVNIKADKHSDALMKNLRGADYEFNLEDNDASLVALREEMEEKDGVITIPLMFSRYSHWIPPSFFESGGYINGTAKFKLPNDPENPVAGKEWKVSLSLKADRKVEPGGVRAVSGRDMFTDKTGGEPVAERECSELIATREEFRRTVKFEVKPSSDPIRAGEEFFVDVKFTDYPGKFELMDITYPSGRDLGNTVVRIKDGRGNFYDVRARRAKMPDSQTVRLYFEAPSMMVGNIVDTYMQFLGVRDINGFTSEARISAKYKIWYMKAKVGNEKFSTVDSVGTDSRLDYYLSGMNFVTEEGKILEGEGMLIEEEKK